MKVSHFKMIIFGFLLTILIVACGGAPTVDVSAVQTYTAQTVVAAVTETGMAASPVPSATTTSAYSPTPALPTDTPVPPTVTPTSTDTPTPLPQGSPTPDTWVFVEDDDFEKNQFWYTEDAENFSLKYDNGTYLITNGLPTGVIYSVRTLSVQNARLEVDAAPIKAAEGGYWGVSCRHDQGNSYYALVIGSANFYGIGKMVDQKFSFIEKGTWPDSNVFKPNDSGYLRVRGDCLDDTLSLYVNGTLLLEVTDDTHKSGEIGLVVGQTYSLDMATQVRFDNYELWKPKP